MPVQPATAAPPRHNPAWAAYVVGRHSSTTGAWLDALREEHRFGIPRRPDRRGIPPGTGRFDQALRELAVAGLVRSAVLVEVHRAADALRQIGWRLWRSASGRDPRLHLRASARAEGLVDVLGTLAPQLLDPAATLQRDWLRLGAAVAVCVREGRDASACGIDPPEEVVLTVNAAVHPLRAETYEALHAIAVVTSSPPPEAGGRAR